MRVIMNAPLWLSSTEFRSGFLLGFGLITHYVLSRNEQAKEKGSAIQAKLVTIPAPLGLLSIIMGVLYIVVVAL